MHLCSIRPLVLISFLALALAGCNNSSDALTSTQSVIANSTTTTNNAPSIQKRPNVIVILADDVGYSDISAFGSEIATPNIDSLAHQGQILTNFHTTPLCATSRVELLTGADHHLVGMGEMGSMVPLYLGAGGKNYKGALDSRGLTIAQLLNDAGYHTYMAGKWGIGGVGPPGEGFEHSFALAYDADYASNFAPPDGYVRGIGIKPMYQPHFEDGKQVAQLPDDFFSSDYYTTKLISYIGADHGDGQPFFAYLPFQATHFPLQAPKKYLDCKKGVPKCYKGVYDVGYKAIRQARLQRMKDKGIIPQDFNPNPGDEAPMIRFGGPAPKFNTPWDKLTATQKKQEERTMEVYAAMLTDMDDNIGRLLDYLKSIGEYNNTMIVFLSDNGPDGMGFGFLPFFDGRLKTDINNSYSNYGRRGSFLFRSTRWAEVGSAPFRLFKPFPAEGGISVPALVKMPNTQSLPPTNAYAHLTDLVPTILALADVAPPASDTYKDRTIAPIEGTSLLPILTGRATSVHPPDEVFVDEIAANRYIRQGQWKLTRFGDYYFPSASLLLPHQWQLFNMRTDRGETVDVADKHPGKVNHLIGYWNQYKQRVGYVPPTLPPDINSDQWQQLVRSVNDLLGFKLPIKPPINLPLTLPLIQN